jgi:hypothetical protein
MRRIVDYKEVEMTDEEFDYFNKLHASFPDGKEQFRDLFDTDGDGCITFIHPPIGKEIGWGILFFVQNLMINQRLRRMEDHQLTSIRNFYDIMKGAKDG